MFADYTALGSEARRQEFRLFKSEDTCLRKQKPVLLRAVTGVELINAISTKPKAEYAVVDHEGKIVTNVDARYAMSLAIRKLVEGRVPEKQSELNHLVIPKTVKVSQIRNVLRLKPPSISICNLATVESVGPGNWWHRSIIGLLRRGGASA